MTVFFFEILKKSFVSFCDAPESWQIGIQDPATPSLEGMLFFHDYIMTFMIVIGVFVCYILTFIYFAFNSEVNKNAFVFTHSSMLEIIWTLIPAFLLVLIAIPSFKLLYSLDE